MPAPDGHTAHKCGPLTVYARDFGTGAALAAHARTRERGLYDHGMTSWTFGQQTPEETTDALTRGEVPAPIAALIEGMRGTIEAAMDASDTQGVSARRRFTFGDQGDEIDTDRLNTGHDQPWRTTRRGKQTRVIRLGINLALSCGNQEGAFHRLAATACAIADVLQARGYASEIVIFASTVHRDYGTWTATHWKAKAADEPLDLGRIASAGLVGVFRSLVLTDWTPWSDGGGLCRDVPAEVRALLGVDYVIARSWAGLKERDIAEGVRQIIEAPAA